DHMCAMRAGSTIAGVIQSRELSRADIANLQAILAEKAKTAPEEVQCNCLPGDQTC
ncbi:CopY/TcrY family copper transport repressor, partial [Bifidobacterium longum]|nr:CopY/TcrY family copper transport repressor [Bifidobacterium longum]